jgi:4-amino-4-deoxy-L-arabinose transferase-like glycosyltransferase
MEAPSSWRRVWNARWGHFTTTQWCLLLVVPALLYLFNLGDARVLTDHEVYHAAVAKQMTLDGEWILLRIGDQFWLEKPPLPHWLAVASAHCLGGFTEFTMRLPFALAGIAAALLVALVMADLFGARIGFLAGLVQATCVYVVRHARLAESDIMLQLIILGAIFAFVRLVLFADRMSRRDLFAWRMAFWICLGLTNVVKGLLFGSVLTLFTCIGWLLLSGRSLRLRDIFSPLGVIVALLIAASWPTAVVLVEPEALELWKQHLFGRAATGIGYGKPFWYYLTQWPEQLAPWTIFVIIGAVPSLRRAWRDPLSADRFLWWWTLGQMALLSLSKGKHHHYLMHALPAMSAVAAMGLLRTEEVIRERIWPFKHWQRAFWIVGVCAPIAGLVAACYDEKYRVDILFLSMLIGGFALTGAWLVMRARPRAIFVAGFVSVMIAQLYVQGVIMPRRDRSREDRAFLRAVQRDLDNDARLFACGGQLVGRHLFYLERPVTGVWYHEDLAEHVHEGDTFYVITRAKDREELEPYGDVELVKQSRHTRRESTPKDRFTLYRVTPTPDTARLAEGDPAVRR